MPPWCAAPAHRRGPASAGMVVVLLGGRHRSGTRARLRGRVSTSPMTRPASPVEYPSLTSGVRVRATGDSMPPDHAFTTFLSRAAVKKSVSPLGMNQADEGVEHDHALAPRAHQHRVQVDLGDEAGERARGRAEPHQ